MDEREPTFRIEAGLGRARLWELVEARVTLTVECVGCHRKASWPPALIRARLGRNLANRLVQVAGRFRCAACRGRFVRIYRERGPGAVRTLTGRADPGFKRGFSEGNLDPNARRKTFP